MTNRVLWLVHDKVVLANDPHEARFFLDKPLTLDKVS